MTERFDSTSSTKLPRWATLTAGAAGLLMVGIGTSRIIRLQTLTQAVMPMIVGSLLAYLSGFEKRLYIDGAGIYQMKAFWGRKKERRTDWDEIDDARLVLNRGENIYLFLRCADKIPPLCFKCSDADGVIKLLKKKLPNDIILIER